MEGWCCSTAVLKSGWKQLIQRTGAVSLVATTVTTQTSCCSFIKAPLAFIRSILVLFTVEFVHWTRWTANSSLKATWWLPHPQASTTKSTLHATMGFLSKRKAKKEAKKAEANAAQAAADGTAAAQAVAKKEAAVKVPGEIKIQHQRGAQSGNKQQRLNKHQSSGGKAIAFRRRILGQGGAKPAPIRSRPPRSPGGQSHVSAITRDTAFPETPKRMLFSPSSNLLPDNDYDDYTDEEDDVGGGVVIAGRWSGGA